MAELCEDKSPYEMTEQELLNLTLTVNFGLTLHNNLPDPGETSLHRLQGSTSNGTEGLGTLDSLPFEIVQTVIQNLDLDTLASFRLVNHKANHVFRQNPSYRWMVKRYSKILLAIQRIRTGKWTTYSHLVSEASRWDCENCGDFGLFFYLLTCRRVCFECFTENTKYLPLRVSYAQQDFGISESMLLQLPNMHCHRGAYAWNAGEIRRRRNLVDRQSASQFALKLHGSIAQMKHAAERMLADEKKRFLERNPNAKAKTVRRLVHGHIDDALSYNTYRHVAIVEMPWWNEAEQRQESGVHCIGCRCYTEARPGLHYQRKFSMQQFRDHINQYGSIYRADCNHSERWRHKDYHIPAGYDC